MYNITWMWWYKYIFGINFVWCWVFLMSHRPVFNVSTVCVCVPSSVQCVHGVVFGDGKRLNALKISCLITFKSFLNRMTYCMRTHYRKSQKLTSKLAPGRCRDCSHRRTNTISTSLFKTKTFPPHPKHRTAFQASPHNQMSSPHNKWLLKGCCHLRTWYTPCLYHRTPQKWPTNLYQQVTNFHPIKM